MLKVKTINFMALQFVSRTSLPILAKGASGKENLAINENGQLILSKKTMNALGIVSNIPVVLGFDGATRSLVIAVATPKLIKLVGGEEGCYQLRVGKKTNQGFFAVSAFLQDPNDEIFGEGKKYDYRASGNQSFDVTIDKKNNTVSCVLPIGALKPRPVVTRIKKADKAKAKAMAATASVGATPSAKATKGDELEDLVDVA